MISIGSTRARPPNRAMASRLLNPCLRTKSSSRIVRSNALTVVILILFTFQSSGSPPKSLSRNVMAALEVGYFRYQSDVGYGRGSAIGKLFWNLAWYGILRLRPENPRLRFPGEPTPFFPSSVEQFWCRRNWRRCL